MIKYFLYLFSLLFFFVDSLNALQRYHLIDIGLLNYQTSEVTSINESGQICGIFKHNAKSYIFIWDPSSNQLNYFKIRPSIRPLINNHSEIFGSQWLLVNDDIWDFDQETIFCWQNPLSFFTLFNVVGLGFPKDAGKYSPFQQERTVLWDVNDHGELVVMNSDSIKDFLVGNPLGFQYRMWIYQKGEYKLVTQLHSCIGISINNRSEVLGYYYKEEDSVHEEERVGTFVYNIADEAIRLLKFPVNGIGRAINDLGQVIGTFYDPLTHTTRGFLSDSFSECIMIDHFDPIKNNNQNLIVGKFLEGEKRGKPAIWEKGQLYDLLEVVDLTDHQGHVWDSLDELVDLNDSGHIIGQGKINGVSHGFLLRPLTQ